MNESERIDLRPVEILQKLIRFDTTNPPGNEKACILYIASLLEQAGIEFEILSELESRPNLVARLKGKGLKPPFLMYGHVDVVGTENMDWKYPPFSGVVEEGCVWGRGTVDMKGGVTMMLASLLRMKAEGLVPDGDILLAVVSDEEVGAHGAKYLVEKHDELFQDVKYAIGEFGGFTLHLLGKKFYPIMVSEKQFCPVRATFKGDFGHGSMGVKDSAMAKAGRFLQQVSSKRLPVHITEPMKLMIGGIVKNLPEQQGNALKMLLEPSMTEIMLEQMEGLSEIFSPLLHNTVNATMLQGSSQINVIPGKVTIDLDGRMLPGQRAADFLAELKAVGGTEGELEIIEYDLGPEKVDLELFDTLGGILQELEPEGIPIPLIVSGVTDARYFFKLGITTYGFTPMLLPQGIDFSQMMHGPNERIPVKALEFGTEAIYRLLNRL